MKKNAVKIGGAYVAKVSGKFTGVRITKVNDHGGWDAINISTNKSVRIKSPARLRGAWVGTDSPTAAADAQESLVDVTTTSKKTPRGKRGAKPAGAKKERPMGGLVAAAEIMRVVGQPLGASEIVKMAFDQGLWMPAGKTPANTLHAAISHEIATKGDASRFVKAERGKFKLA